MAINPATSQQFGGGLLAGGQPVSVADQAMRNFAAFIAPINEARKEQLKQERAIEEKMAPYNFLKGYYDAQAAESTARAWRARNEPFDTIGMGAVGAAGGAPRRIRADIGDPGPSKFTKFVKGVPGAFGKGVEKVKEAGQFLAEDVGQSQTQQFLIGLSKDQKVKVYEVMTAGPTHPKYSEMEKALMRNGIRPDVATEVLRRMLGEG